MITSIYGKRRRVSIEYRILHIPTGESFVLYQGQLKDFCECFDLNYTSGMSMRCKTPYREVPLYPNKYKQIHPGTKKQEPVYYMLPAILSQIQP